MKINEETLTYLNQGQPYEIKLKKLGDLTQLRGKVFKVLKINSARGLIRNDIFCLEIFSVRVCP